LQTPSLFFHQNLYKNTKFLVVWLSKKNKKLFKRTV